MPAAAHRRLYDELSDLQDRLGALCDAMVAAERLRGWLDEATGAASREGLPAALRRQEQALARQRQRFVAWWTVPRREKLRRHLQKSTDA
jgi:CHAD domain-containing protein